MGNSNNSKHMNNEAKENNKKREFGEVSLESVGNVNTKKAMKNNMVENDKRTGRKLTRSRAKIKETNVKNEIEIENTKIANDAEKINNLVSEKIRPRKRREKT